MLIIERNETCRQILANQIAARFSYLDVDTASTRHEALQLLRDKRHDIVAFDAPRDRDELLKFILEMCAITDPIMLVITDDTEIEMDFFRASIDKLGVKHFACKPIDLQVVMLQIEDLVHRVETRKSGCVEVGCE